MAKLEKSLSFTGSLVFIPQTSLSLQGREKQSSFLVKTGNFCAAIMIVVMIMTTIMIMIMIIYIMILTLFKSRMYLAL